ncbi:hypothetical protein Hamer_G026579 [Homarus americanus]|uniref:Uncharacterized protein n=1 Tax=Homarus americanus TaxID=6706 RepID=A0A8J5JMY5_HOMAM|nr:hypothetical protein Hamer_G026579 [Homarus americanus]
MLVSRGRFAGGFGSRCYGYEGWESVLRVRWSGVGVGVRREFPEVNMMASWCRMLVPRLVLLLVVLVHICTATIMSRTNIPIGIDCLLKIKYSFPYYITTVAQLIHIGRIKMYFPQSIN